ncbi:MAG: vitamin B12 dependent-methionine synthase activation domain-containing protein, partial [Bacteroidota bacterium]
AKKMLQTFDSEKCLAPVAITAVYPAVSKGDDVLLYSDDEHMCELKTLNFLRQQVQSDTNFCVSDFIRSDHDYMGAFVCSAGVGLNDLVQNFRRAGDEYSAILAQTLADRLAEALSEFVHEKVRKEIWGFSKDENLSMEEMFTGKYRGARLSPGYPACPDHSEKRKLFDILKVEFVCSLKLTSSFMIDPVSSVCGWIIANPQSTLFSVGRIGEDQLHDYASRKGLSIDETQHCLSTNL